MVDTGDGPLAKAQIRMDRVWQSMKGVFTKMWEHKSVVIFAGSVAFMHFFGDELAV